MTDTKISDLTALSGGLAAGDLFVLVDVSDTTMAASGTDKRVTAAELTGQVQVRTYSGTTDTCVLTDQGLVIRATNAGASTSTIPPNSSVAFPVGATIGFYSAGAGGLTLAPGAGVTIRNNSVALVQYQEVSLRKDATDEWVRCG